jgi:membrane-associated phospholipid phosphatase
VSEALHSFLWRDLHERLGDPTGSLPEPRWTIAGAGFACALAGTILLQVSGYHAGFAALNDLAARLPAWSWQVLTAVGNERVVFALALFFSRRHPRVFWSLVVAGVLGATFTLSLKHLVAANRPPAVLQLGTFSLIGPALRRASFPSGHSVTAALFFGVWAQQVRPGWARVALAVAPVAVGASRVASGVHWPVDVAGGLAGGFFAAWLGGLVAQRWPRGRSNPILHLTFVGLAALVVANLVLSSSADEVMVTPIRALAFAALSSAASSYLVAPAWRWQRRWRRPLPG